jgi:hypothetical protein
MTSDQFNEKWKDHLEEGHYGLAIDDKKVTEYLDKKFTEFKEKYPNFTYSQIKLKYSFPCVYMDPWDINKAEIEKDINDILLSNNPFKVGDRVHHIPYEGCSPSLYKNGIVKAVNSGYTCFVVYSCANDWDNYQDYTGANTYIKDLKSDWYE